MKLRNLTDFAVTKAKPKPVAYEISDGGQRGLRLAVHPTGQKSWVVRYRHPVSGRSRKMTLQPGLGLAQARKLAVRQPRLGRTRNLHQKSPSLGRAREASF